MALQIHPKAPSLDGLRQGGGGGEGGLAGTPPPPRVPLWSLPKFFRLKSSWRQSKILAVSPKHWKGRRAGGSRGGGVPPSSYHVRLFQYITGMPPPHPLATWH